MKIPVKKHDFSNPESWTFAAIVYLYSPKDEDHAQMIEGILNEMVYANSANIGCDVWDAITARENAAPNSRFVDRSTCDHCGANFNYGAAYVNAQGEYAIVGNTCASKNLNLTAHEYSDKKARSLVKSAKSRAKADLAMSKLLPNRAAALNVENQISIDIKSYFRKWHSLTKAQWALVKKIAQQEADYQDEKAQEPAPIAIPSDLLKGRHEITGVLLGTKTQESDYRLVYKMLVRDDRGFKIWGTCPDALAKAYKGDKISFFATIQASNDDECFGFFKRPTKASFQQAGES